ncbi:MAG: hypothetical protein XD87_0470 [candidate division WS6 bacterium 36_33]|uniref:Uncharacterized protein n=1 Tax=candidate division WS6 bacterium 36_33 TaxID=1641388 RepID=A0A101GY48_9BACT|nr:MAG: hypothetical protein XD87_0470 [candidate division WS6 bacterium 36_33]
MKENILEKIKENISEISEKNEGYIKLIELRTKVIETFDKQIDKLLEEKRIVKRIKFPKVKFNWKYLVSMPFIYSMIIPTVFLHISIQIYQQVCFRLYGIPTVKQKEYLVYDRKLLSLLNPIEKFNCIYCSYVNNILRFSTEIGARTERYWCPIKYYRRIDKTHSQYDKFVEETKSRDEFDEKWEELRDFSDLETNE